MDNEKQMVIANLLNSVIQDEWEAIEAYNSVIATLSDYDGEDIDGIIANLEDIRDEEYVHVGQLESCLSVLKSDPVEQIDDGSEEGFEKLELPEEDDEVNIEVNESFEDGEEHMYKAKLSYNYSDGWSYGSNNNVTTTIKAYDEEDARIKLRDKYPEYKIVDIEQASSYGSSQPTRTSSIRRGLKLKTEVEERLDKDVIKDKGTQEEFELEDADGLEIELDEEFDLDKVFNELDNLGED